MIRIRSEVERRTYFSEYNDISLAARQAQYIVVVLYERSIVLAREHLRIVSMKLSY